MRVSCAHWNSRVELRNKSAHGALKVTFFNRIEDALFAALKQLLSIISFDPFQFYGRYGRSNAFSFLEPGSIERRSRNAHLWVESPVLAGRILQNHSFFELQRGREEYLTSSIVRCTTARRSTLTIELEPLYTTRSRPPFS